MMVTENDVLNTGMVGLVEVEKGEIVARSPNSYRQNLVANNLFALLEPYAALGMLARGQIGFVLRHSGKNIETLRLPDVSYLRTLPQTSGHSFIYRAPDLAVKVKADYETASDLEAMVLDYLQAGARQVWLVYPRDEELYVYCAPQVLEYYGAQDKIEVSEIFPTSVTLQISDLFRYPWHKQAK